tara:strand:- start:373 stop:570 length:198 start_codon:yes stop_codon:yes gene_type:complete
MEYSELSLYDIQGGEAFMKKNVVEDKKEELDENDKVNLRKYKKKIIEQRNEIERLKKELEKYKNN